MTYITKRGKCLTTLPSISQVTRYIHKRLWRVIFTGLCLGAIATIPSANSLTTCQSDDPLQMPVAGALEFRYDKVKEYADYTKLAKMAEPIHSEEFREAYLMEELDSPASNLYLTPKPETVLETESGDDSESANIDASASDEALLLNVVFLEAGNQDIEGMRLVCDVILNRLEDDRFPDSIHDIIFQKGQFGKTAIRLKSQQLREDIPQQVKDAVSMELSGPRLDDTALYFSTSPVTTLGLYQHGAHYFSR